MQKLFKNPQKVMQLMVGLSCLLWIVSELMKYMK